MSIEHADFDAIKQIGLHTVVLPSEIIREFKNSHAIHLWCYLQTCTPDWKPMRNALMKRCHMTEYHYRPAMRYLKAIGLVMDEDLRDEQGKIVKKTLKVLGIPRNMDEFLERCKQVDEKGYTHVVEDHQHGEEESEPMLLNSHNVDLPQCGISPPLSTDQCLSSSQRSKSLPLQEALPDSEIIGMMNKVPRDQREHELDRIKNEFDGVLKRWGQWCNKVKSWEPETRRAKRSDTQPAKHNLSARKQREADADAEFCRRHGITGSAL